METKQIVELAQTTWLLALEFAEKNGITFHSNGTRGHAVNVKGGTTRFIRKAAKEHNVKGMTKVDRDAVRRFLSDTRNIFTLERLDGPVNYRVFVRNDWNDERDLREPAGETRYRVKDTGQSPGGESGPVETRRISDEFESEPLGPAQAENLKVLYTHGGKIEDRTGFTCTDHGLDASTIRRLVERGLVSTKKKNARRFFKVELTTKGWWVSERLSFMQIAEVAVAFFLSRVGSFEGSTPRQTIVELAERTYKTHATALKGVQTLVEQGRVSVVRTSDSSSASYKRLTWTGADVPGVHLSSPRSEEAEMNERELADWQYKHQEELDARIEEDEIVPAEIEPTTVTNITNITQERPDRITKIIEELEQFFGGADQQEFDALKAQVHMVRRTCEQFAEGEIGALRALANIDDIVNDRKQA